MELIESGDSFLIMKLNYPIIVDKTEIKESKWGPWQSVKNKE